MAVRVVHAKTSGVADVGNPTLVQPSDWNADHTITGLSFRETLTTDRIYYVRTDGSDSNNGIANTSGGAFLTIQKALDVAATLDFGGWTVYISIANGTYTAAIVVPVMVGQKLPSNLVLVGNTGSPSSVVLAQPNSWEGCIAAGPGARCRALGMRFSGPGNAHGLHAQSGSVLEYSTVDFGTGLFYQVYGDGGIVKGYGSYSISAGGFAHWGCEGGGRLTAVGAGTITITGTPAFSGAFALCDTVSYMRLDGNTFSGAPTGPRYYANNNGCIDTKGAGATYLPGSIAGTTGTGGIYI